MSVRLIIIDRMTRSTHGHVVNYMSAASAVNLRPILRLVKAHDTLVLAGIPPLFPELYVSAVVYIAKKSASHLPISCVLLIAMITESRFIFWIEFPATISAIVHNSLLFLVYPPRGVTRPIMEGSSYR
jgi:hypothetical protein